MENSNTMDIRKHLLAGGVIPALPLALDEWRRFSPAHQRALVRYYVAAGCSGLAVAATTLYRYAAAPGDEEALVRRISAATS